MIRYEVANGNASWEDAERQIREAQKKGGKSTTVSVKSTNAAAQNKRKAGEALEEAHKEMAGAGGKKSKKGKKSR